MTIGKALLFLLGVVLLLPGICSLLFSPFVWQYPDLGVVLIWLTGFGIAVLGVFAIRAGFRNFDKNEADES